MFKKKMRMAAVLLAAGIMTTAISGCGALSLHRQVRQPELTAAA